PRLSQIPEPVPLALTNVTCSCSCPSVPWPTRKPARQEHFHKVVFVHRKFTHRHAGHPMKCRTAMNGTRSTTSTVSGTSESVPPQTTGVPVNANNKRLRTGGLGAIDTSSVACPGHHTTVTIVTASSVVVLSRPIKFEDDDRSVALPVLSGKWKDKEQPIFVADVFVRCPRSPVRRKSQEKADGEK
ncbi:hypothetical protein BGW80DRAFT_1295863, partial [Lactifluus volemus]